MCITVINNWCPEYQEHCTELCRLQEKALGNRYLLFGMNLPDDNFIEHALKTLRFISPCPIIMGSSMKEKKSRQNTISIHNPITAYLNRNYASMEMIDAMGRNVHSMPHAVSQTHTLMQNVIHNIDNIQFVQHRLNAMEMHSTFEGIYSVTLDLTDGLPFQLTLYKKMATDKVKVLIVLLSLCYLEWMLFG